MLKCYRFPASDPAVSDDVYIIAVFVQRCGGHCESSAQGTLYFVPLSHCAILELLWPNLHSVSAEDHC
jgi:hypothetical protein